MWNHYDPTNPTPKTFFRKSGVHFFHHPCAYEIRGVPVEETILNDPRFPATESETKELGVRSNLYSWWQIHW